MFWSKPIHTFQKCRDKRLFSFLLVFWQKKWSKVTENICHFWPLFEAPTSCIFLTIQKLIMHSCFHVMPTLLLAQFGTSVRFEVFKSFACCCHGNCLIPVLLPINWKYCKSNTIHIIAINTILVLPFLFHRKWVVGNP